MALLAYLAAHWVLVIITVLVVAGLTAACVILKNLKFALAAVAVAIAGFMYQGAVMSGIQTQMQKDIAEQSEIYRGRVDALNTLALKNAAQANADADKINDLESRASETPKNDGACLDASAASRVRAIGAIKPRSTAASARRYPSLFSKGSR